MARRSISKSPRTEGQVRVHVVRKEGGWVVKREGAARATGVYSTQAAAAEAARSTLRRSGGELTIQGPDGGIRESMTLGRDAMARIAAVEGVHLSSEWNRRLAELDRIGASGDERRRSIARQFGKA